MTVQVAQRGVVTLPKSLRDAYNIKSGEVFTVIDLGNGSFVLSRGRSKLDDLLDGIRDELEAKGESLESMLLHLRAIREGRTTEPADAPALS
ncbi:MAG: hypothetical protein DCC57_13200 [Chloroflexi bacterium]|nr:MAG: hypothetical protein DCC57_13200 [Chloroflexota bacterium]